MRPSRVPVAPCAALAVALLATACDRQPASQPEPAATPLTAGRTVERAVAAGDTLRLRLDVAAGVTAHLAVRGIGIDVAARLLDGAGGELTAVDNRYADEAPEEIWFRAGDGPPPLVLEVGAAADAETGEGRVRVRLEAPVRGERARLALAAAEAMRRGWTARAEQTAEGYAAADDAFRRARELWRQVEGGERDEAEAVLARGTTAIQVADFRRARGWTEEAADLLRTLGSRRRALDAAFYTGWTSYRLGETERALERYESLLPEARAVGYRSMEATLLTTIGSALAASGDHQRGLDRLQQARRLFHRLGSPLEMQTLNNIASVYRVLGEPARAADVYRQILEFHRGNDDLQLQAGTQTGLGMALLEAGETAAAADALAGAAELFAGRGDRYGEAEALRNLGSAYQRLGRTADAVDALDRALALDREVANPAAEAGTLTSLGEVLLERGRAAEARALFSLAFRGWRLSGRRRDQVAVLHGLAGAARELGRTDEAVARARQAVELVEVLRETPAEPSLRASYLAVNQDVYASLVELLMQLHAEAPAAGHDVRAFEVSERARARALLDTVAAGTDGGPEAVDPDLAARERSLSDEVAELQIRSLERSAAAASAADARRLDGLLDELDAVRSAVRRQRPAFARLAAAPPADLATVRRAVLKPGEALLHYALGEDASVAWVVTRDGHSTHVLASRQRVESAAATYRQRVTRSAERSERHAAERAGAAVAELLLEPLLPALAGARRLLVAPPAGLGSIPFAALPAGGEERLVARYEVAQVPSASVLLALRERAPRRAAEGVAEGSVAVIADPVFSPGDPRFGRDRPAGAAALPPRGEVVPGAVVRRARPGVWPLPRLPHTRAEASSIRHLAPARVDVALGFEANRDLVLGGGLRGHRLVHLATHALVDVERPDLSGLVLSLYGPDGESRPGFVALHDLVRIDLSADLVVLSACATALGRELPGAGQISLGRGLLLAGAGAVVVSLWEVDDAATTELMRRFYRHLLGRGAAPAAALAAAQREMAGEPRWSAPYHWAGFVLQGDPLD